MAQIDGEDVAKAVGGGGILAIIISWLTGKRKARIDVLKQEVEATLLMVKGWKEEAEWWKNNAEEWRQRVDKLELQVIGLEKKIREQDRIIYNLTHGKK